MPGDPLNEFKCNNIDFYDFKSHAELGSATGEGSSSWGWTSPNGREFVAVAQADGAAFAEITRRMSFQEYLFLFLFPSPLPSPLPT